MKKNIFLLFFFTITLHLTGQNFGNALHFNGNDNYIECNLPTNITSLLNNQFTVEAWIKPEANTHPSRILFAQSDANNFFNLLLSINNKLYMYVVINGTLYTFNSPTIIPYGVWSHVAFTWNKSNNEAQLFINGPVDNLNAGGGSSSIQNNNIMTIGGQSNNNDLNCKGSMDEVRVWDHARTLCDINTFKNIEIPALAGLICYYQFNEGIPNSDNTAISTTADVLGQYNGTLKNFILNSSTSNFTNSNIPYTPLVIQYFDECDSFIWNNGRD